MINLNSVGQGDISRMVFYGSLKTVTTYLGYRGAWVEQENTQRSQIWDTMGNLFATMTNALIDRY